MRFEITSYYKSSEMAEDSFLTHISVWVMTFISKLSQHLPLLGFDRILDFLSGSAPVLITHLTKKVNDHPDVQPLLKHV